jgi:oligopeptide/dipeptide ABC transporter ATP-binding protein
MLELDEVSVRYAAPGGRAHPHAAVEGVSFTIEAGELPGLVGESGSGKTTLARAILQLVPLADGAVRWRGQRVDRLNRREFRPLRRELQLVFQDPAACLDPRMTISRSIAEPLRALAPGLAGAGQAARVRELMSEVGLQPALADRYPHQLSGGQLQRAVIARALIVGPRFIAFDEPVSALDVSVQGQVVNLLARIRRERGLSGLFISHNLAIVARLCERIMVMFRGRIVESAPRAALIGSPLHPYTRALLDSVPAPDVSFRSRLRAHPAPVAAEHPAPGAVAVGCAYAKRCAFAVGKCRSERPPLAAAGTARLVACHRAGEWPAGVPATSGSPDEPPAGLR